MALTPGLAHVTMPGMSHKRPGARRGSRSREAAGRPGPGSAPPSHWRRRLGGLGRFGLAVAGALALVLGGLRLYGWYRLQASERALATALGDSGGFVETPVGGEGTAAPAVRTALDRAGMSQRDVEDLAEVAGLGAAPLSADQRSRAERLVAEHAVALDALRSSLTLPAARLGFWQNVEPEREGEIQAGLLALAQLASVDGRLACEQADADRFAQATGILLRLATGLEMEGQTQPVLVGLMVENTEHLLLMRGVSSKVADHFVRTGPDGLLPTVDLRQAFFQTLRSQVDRLRALRSPGEPSIQNLPSWLGDLVYFDLYLARSLDEVRAAAHDVDQPLLAPVAATAGLPEFAPVALAGTLGTAGRVQIVEAGRSFARAAFALRRHALDRGSYPSTLAEVPEAAAALSSLRIKVEIEPRADGGAKLRLPGGDEHLRDLIGDPTMPSLLTWELPPPPGR